MAAAIGGAGGGVGIGAASGASASSATGIGSMVGELAPDDTADIQDATWRPTKTDDDELCQLLQALLPQSPAAATPTTFGS